MNSFSDCIQRISDWIRNAENVFKIMGMVMLFVLMILGTADVVGRYLFRSPITGTVESGRMMLMVIVVFGWAYTQATKSHVSVDFLVSRFPLRAQLVTDFITSILALGLFVLITWQAIVVGLANLQDGRHVPIIGVPVGIMDFIVSLGAIFICAELIIQTVNIYLEIVHKKQREPKQIN